MLLKNTLLVCERNNFNKLLCKNLNGLFESLKLRNISKKDHKKQGNKKNNFFDAFVVNLILDY